VIAWRSTSSLSCRLAAGSKWRAARANNAGTGDVTFVLQRIQTQESDQNLSRSLYLRTGVSTVVRAYYRRAASSTTNLYEDSPARYFAIPAHGRPKFSAQQAGTRWLLKRQDR